MIHNFDLLPDCALVRLKTVCELWAISPATAWRRVASGDLPQPQKFGKRTTCWQVGELRAALSKK